MSDDSFGYAAPAAPQSRARAQSSQPSQPSHLRLLLTDDAPALEAGADAMSALIHARHAGRHAPLTTMLPLTPLPAQLENLLHATGCRPDRCPPLPESPAGALAPRDEQHPDVKRIGAYYRYSSHMQHDGYSIPAQQRAVLQEAQTRGNWQVVAYVEPEHSAFTEDLTTRPVFLSLLRDVFEGRLDGVVVHKLDRFSRQLIVTSVTLRALEQCGAVFLSIAEHFDCTTPSGFLQAHLLGLLAEFYSRNLGAEIGKGKRERVERDGLSLGRTPFGYTKPPLPPGLDADSAVRWLRKAVPIPDDAREEGTWHGLQLIIALALEGRSDVEIADTLNRDGHAYSTYHGGNGHRAGDGPRRWTKQAVQRVRSNPFYRPFSAAPRDDDLAHGQGQGQGHGHGTLVHRGEQYRGAHVPACSWEEWHRMQEGAARRKGVWHGRGYAAATAASVAASGAVALDGVSPRTRHQGGAFRRGAVLRAEEVPTLGIPHEAEFRGIAVCAGCGGRLYVRRSVHHPHTDAQRSYERYVCQADERTGKRGDHRDLLVDADALNNCDMERAPAQDRPCICPDLGYWARVGDVREAWLLWARTHLAPLAPAWQDVARGVAEDLLSGRLAGDGSAEADAVSASARPLFAAPDDPAYVARRERLRLERALDCLRADAYEGALTVAEYRRRKVEVQTHLAALDAVARPLDARREELVSCAGVLAHVADYWRLADTDERIALASLILPPGGLTVRCLGHGRTLSPGLNFHPERRAEVRAQTPLPPSCELVAVTLRPVYATALLVVEETRTRQQQAG